MLRPHIARVLAALLCGGALAACSTPPSPARSAGPGSGSAPTPQLGQSPLGDVIAALTRDEKVRLVLGTGMDIPDAPPEMQAPQGAQSASRVAGAAAQTHAIARLGIPSLVLADGPAGLRIEPARPEAPGETFYATAFPIGTALSASWDSRLAQEVGAAMGAEARGYGVDILLAPALNIQRIALGGRNFEYYSEDPLLSGKMAAAMVRGIQSAGVGTSVKHFVANNQEWNRMVLDVRLGERALREIYLRGFEIVVREAQPWTVMSSYNKVNGSYTSEDPRLLTAVLRGEWGFEGLVMSDWLGGRNPVAQMGAGNDLLMPGLEVQRQALLAALESGALSESVLDRNLERVLRLVLRSSAFSNNEKGDPSRPKASPHPAVDLKAGSAIARAAAAQSAVLLKNEGSALPLALGLRLALFGNGSYETVSGGTGSGDVHEAYTVSFAQGLAAAGFEIHPELSQRYQGHLARENAALPERRGMQLFMPVELPPELSVARSEFARLAGQVDVGVLTLRRSSGEFSDREPSDFSLSSEERGLLRRASRAFRAAGKPLVVLLNVGAPIELASWRDWADALLVTWQPGQEAGHAIADVLSGSVNPSGKLPATWPLQWDAVPAAAGYPGKVLIPGDPKRPPPFGGARAAAVDYLEALEVGYRSLPGHTRPVAYRFGHGLSYTQFDYGSPTVARLAADSASWAVSVTVTNRGPRAGAEVVQLYVSAPQGSLPKPERELRAFAKTPVLAPGASETIQFHLGLRDLASFDVQASAWSVAAGRYELGFGASASGARPSASFFLTKAEVLPSQAP